VSEPGYEVARLEEIRGPRSRHGYDWHPIRRHFGIGAFGANANVAREAGDVVVDEHDEVGNGPDGGQQELYVVLRGHATFELDGEKVDAPACTLVFVGDPAVKRAATAVEPDTAVLVLGGRPGEAFRTSAWESVRFALERSEGGDHDGAVRIVEALLAERPDDPRVLYDLACFESLAGRADDSLGHLRRSIELDPEYRGYARDDEDFDPIRADPRFGALLGT
jgi:tetratricopeptide (TPR) repeat protein